MENQSWLAIETSTDVLSLAVSRGDTVWSHTSEGGAKSSEQTLPQIQRLMGEAGLPFSHLQAVVFGRGPGAFTGLRTACAVAQGLAFGAGVPVLPLDTLLAVAEQARLTQADISRVLVVVDARMDQVYLAAYEHSNDGWVCVQDAQVLHPEHIHWPSHWLASSYVAAGNAWAVAPSRWPAGLTATRLQALPTATALLRLAPQAWAQGQAVAPQHALPLYVRDKVAQTTAEREQAHQATMAP